MVTEKKLQEHDNTQREEVALGMKRLDALKRKKGEKHENVKRKYKKRKTQNGGKKKRGKTHKRKNGKKAKKIREKLRRHR